MNDKTVEMLFDVQDSVIPYNASTALVEVELVTRSLNLVHEVAAALHTPEVKLARTSKGAEHDAAETACINLLHASWTTLVSAFRLSLWGAHVDALTLTRSAFEHAYHAEYFCLHPEQVPEWHEAGAITDLTMRRRHISEFQSARKIRRVLEAVDDPKGTRSRVFHELSTYGTHANPVTVSLKICSDKARTGIANFGYASAGKTEATQACVRYVLHVLVYVLTLHFEYHDEYIAGEPRLIQEYQAVKKQHDTVEELEFRLSQ